MKKRLLLLMLIFVALACRNSTAPRLYDHPEFTFTYPVHWHLMSEVFPQYETGRDYYRLGVREIVMVTSVQKAGQSGAYFAVASAPLPEALDLETFQRQCYQPFAEGLGDVSEQTVMIHDSPAVEVTYTRPWGEAWWQFRDLWLERDGIAYLLSFHALSLADYQQEMDAILDSFSFKSEQASPTP